MYPQTLAPDHAKANPCVAGEMPFEIVCGTARHAGEYPAESKKEKVGPRIAQNAQSVLCEGPSYQSP